MGYKVFTAGEEALASDVNSLLMSQTVARFASASARSTQLTAPVLNQLSMLDSRPGGLDMWNGSAWEPGGPGSELAYSQYNGIVNVTNTTAAAAHLVVDGVTRNYDGSTVIVEFFAPNVIAPNAAVIYIGLFELPAGSPAIAVIGSVGTNGAPVSAPVFARQRVTPSAGSHNYRIGAWLSTAGSGQVQGGNGVGATFSPAYIRIVRL
jgi:hypothetical protein